MAAASDSEERAVHGGTMNTTDADVVNSTNGSAPTSEAPLVNRYFSSPLEESLTYVYIVVAFLLVAGGNSAFVTTIARTVKFHTAQYAILVSFSALDMLMITASAIIFITMAIMKDDTPTPVCEWMSTIAIGSFFGGAYQIGAVAWERYMFFCRPMYYHRFVNKYTVTAILGGIVWGLSFLYVIITQVTMGRIPNPVILSCQLGYPLINSPIQFGACLVPSLVMTVFAAIKIYQLMTGLRVAPAPAPGAVQPPPSNTMTPKAAMRMILLVAGAFWGTYIPGYIMRILVFGAGYTWTDLNTRRYVAMSIALRFNNFFLVTCSSSLNPMIYFFTHKDVRQEFKKMLGFKVEAASDGEYPTPPPQPSAVDIEK